MEEMNDLVMTKVKEEVTNEFEKITNDFQSLKETLNNITDMIAMQHTKEMESPPDEHIENEFDPSRYDYELPKKDITETSKMESEFDYYDSLTADQDQEQMKYNSNVDYNPHSFHDHNDAVKYNMMSH